MATQGTDIRASLETLYRRIEVERMDGVPILNRALSVAGFGFAPWQDHALGVLLTPWFMNLILVPLDQESFAETAPRVGAKISIMLPAGQVEFIVGHEEGFGYSLSCSLFSPVFEFADQEAAEETAQAALAEVMAIAEPDTEEDADADMRAIWAGKLPEPIPDISNPVPSEVSRREFLRGGTAASSEKAQL